MKYMRRAIEVLLPVSVFSFLLSYCYSCLPCYVHSISSFLQSSLNHHLTTRRAMILLAHAILLFLTKTSSTTATSVSSTLSYEQHGTTSLDRDDDDGGIVLRFLQPADGSDVLELDEPHAAVREVEKSVIEESVVLLESLEAEEIQLLALEGSSNSTTVGCLELVAVKEEGIVGVDGKELVIVDELELLDIDELNRRFDEFIKKEKKKMRMEA